ncbi:ubiquitin carboxyl-terminal hydrolase 17-like protein B [Apodemus sylvaticus]|uniref:ubiquitin carboxyl-terminal hydrolase 17-like protein B n=1 Tax=Apodemus sylvaticus TaxID=10129 RepID=UPI00224269D6|nr:ubiquitin carboxyl-terminal hydrolase 17-like protein B [Apodemus sylvaticus]
MVVPPPFTEGDPALSSPGIPELHQDESQVVEELSALGKHSVSWERPRGPGCGLQNTGNSCYLNAALQCLTHTPPLADYMLSRQHSQTCCSQEGCKMCAMEAHVTQSLLHSHTGNVMKPSQMLTSAFHKQKQEDAHEFLMFTLNTMHESCLRGSKKWQATCEDSSPILDIFGGCWRSQIKCLHCQGTSDSYDCFLDIPLDISSVQSVKQALGDTVGAEELRGENAYYCGRCREKMPASKTLKVYSAPKVLLLVLNRFSAFTGNKLDRKVSYPEFLDLQPYLSQPIGRSLPYALYGILVHEGLTSHSGHYLCYVKAGHGTWYKMDDSKVTRCDVTSVLSVPAYVLFYVQQTDLQKVNVGRAMGRVHEVLDPELQLKKSQKRKNKKRRSPCQVAEAAGERPCGQRETTASQETSLLEGKVLQEQNQQKAGQKCRNVTLDLQEENHWKAGQNLGNMERVLQEQNHRKDGQKFGNRELLLQGEDHQNAGQNLRNTQRDLPANAIGILQPRYTANWGRNAPDKENQPCHKADRLLTSQGPNNTGQLCIQGERPSSKKGKNNKKKKNKNKLLE